MMPVDDALALAGHVLTAYASGPEDTPGLDLVWADQLARALRELADAVSVWHVTPGAGRPAAVTGAAGAGTAQPVRRAGRAGSGLGRLVRRRAGRVLEPGAVVLSAADAATVELALADAGTWHVVYGDCAACVGTGGCADPRRHAGLAGAYAVLRARLGGEAR